jgi:DNA-binding CsgD family transcriptional regulator
MKILITLGAISLYLGCIYIALGSGAQNLITVKDGVIFVVGCIVFYFFTSRNTTGSTFRDAMHRIQKSCLCSGTYSSVVLSFAFFLDGDSVRMILTSPQEGRIGHILVHTCLPLLYSFLLYLILRLFDVRVPKEAVIVNAPGKFLDALSSREKEVALLIAEGYTNQEIGERLFISPFTVKKHAYNIFAKLNVQQRSEIKYLLDASRGAPDSRS